MKKILIVEDDTAMVLGLESALQAEGYETLTAYTGPDGLRFAKENQPDLLILDLMLPGMSGFEICKRVRDEGTIAPIIMLTSKTEENDKVLGLELGADDYVTKPFSLREFLARVKAHLRRYENSSKAIEDESLEQFGATNIEDLGWEQIMDSYACILCYRCQLVCPAYNTGKVLSPAALEINKRYFLNQD